MDRRAEQSLRHILTYSTRHPMKFVTRNVGDNSTGNLNKHIRDCVGVVSAGNKSITDFAAGCTYHREAFCALLVQWVAGCRRPFQIVEDEPLRRAFKIRHNTGINGG